MTKLSRTLPQWLWTIKFKIVLMALVSGMLCAFGTVQLVRPTMQQSIEKLLLEGAGHERERSAALFASKLQMLQTVLGSVARDVAGADLHDAPGMETFLTRLPAFNALFSAVFIATPDGNIQSRLDKGVPSVERPNIADREYFQRVLRTDQPVVSKPIIGRVSKMPLIILAAPVLAPNGTPIGMVGGSIALQSSALFAELAAGQHVEGARDLVMDRNGTVLAHSESHRVMGAAGDEPGLKAIVAEWRQSGSPIDTVGSGVHVGGHLVSMAGIPMTDWVVVRLTPESAALAPLAAARSTAWAAAAVVGVVAALLAGAAGWFMTRPISQLRQRAERLLVESDATVSAWPHSSGEIGELARAFEHVVTQRTQRQTEVQALLAQLEAVLDHAEVGIALTRNSRFELVSRHFCHVFRCEKVDALGQPTRMIYASDEAYAALASRARPAFIEHGAYDCELKLMRRTGQEFWARMRGRAVVPGDTSKGTIWTIEDVTAAREHREQLTFTATHDSLTGLANRAAFEAQLEGVTATASQMAFCALFIDLDRFKQVNDRGGHAAGDALLRDMAQQITAQVRKSDVVARLGGDEFAVLLPNCPLPKARLLAENIRCAVVDYRLLWEGGSYGVGASIGLVQVAGDFGSAADVLRAADAACYAAKRAGRNRVVEHGQPMAPSVEVVVEEVAKAVTEAVADAA